MKKFKNPLVIVLCILAVAFNVISFLIPVRSVHPASFWLADLFAAAALAFQYYTAVIAFDKYQGALSKVYGYPVIGISLRYLTFQFIVSGVVILLCAFGVMVPVWLIAIPSIVLFVYAAVGLIVTEQAREIVEQKEESFQAQTNFMQSFAADVRSMIAMTEDKEIKKMLEKLAEDIRYSDPVSSNEIREQEDMIQRKCVDLISAVTCQSPDTAERIREISMLLVRRNELCRVYKRKSSNRGSLN
ncbi:MAG: hypothetical protein PUG60_07370 [Lachnospiraceae bacterium]|nr:hypothetical protein [Lachnospiraceae bacterium]